MNFPQYGRMDLAYKGAEDFPYKILMSHDPSHWEKEVQPKYPYIDLTLSGHTHACNWALKFRGSNGVRPNGFTNNGLVCTNKTTSFCM
jgi:predicted MPP superfamily phosphohydrolase